MAMFNSYVTNYQGVPIATSVPLEAFRAFRALSCGVLKEGAVVSSWGHRASTTNGDGHGDSLGFFLGSFLGLN